MFVDRLSDNDEPGPERRHRPRKRIIREYRVRSDGTLLTCSYSRFKHPPWGFGGGREGSPNYIEVVRRAGGHEVHAVVTGLRLDEDDVIRVVTGNGAGWGDPALRPPEEVAEDLKNGYTTAERAQ